MPGATQPVSLGRGTVILIALIVLLVGQSGTDNRERELRWSRSEVKRRRAAVEAQSVRMGALKAEMRKARESMSCFQVRPTIA
jgi:hypothetical protein